MGPAILYPNSGMEETLPINRWILEFIPLC